MRCCLLQLAQRPTPVFSLYRAVKDGQMTFDGGLKWDVTSKSSEITVSETVGDRRENISAIFSPKPATPSGLPGPNSSLAVWFERFNKTRQQFLAIQEIFSDICIPNVTAYGQPVHELWHIELSS